MKVNGKDYRTVWLEDGVVKLINQPLLPDKFEIYSCKDYKETASAIKNCNIFIKEVIEDNLNYFH